jgi:hypothetical protein
MQNTLKDWTESRLVKFLRDYFDSQPPSYLPTLRSDTLSVVRLLTIEDQITFTKATQWRKIGGSGEPAFQNSWVSWGSPYAPPGFWKDPLGFVILRGVIKSGTVGSVAFTLPPGCRPEYDLGPLPVFSNAAFGRLDIKADGTVTPITPSSNVNLTLDNIRFKAA